MLGEAARISEHPADRAQDPELMVRELSSSDWQVRRGACTGLATLDDAALDSRLLELVDDEDPGTRNAAVKALIKRGDEALPVLVSGLVSDDSRVRILCAVAIGQVGAASAVPLLRDLYEHESDDNVRYMVVEALGRIDSPAVVPLLLRALDDGPWLAAPAAEALGRVGARAAVQPLIALLEDEMIGGVAADALGRIGDMRALVPLMERGSSVSEAEAEPLLLAVGHLLDAASPIARHTADVLQGLTPQLSGDARRTLAKMTRSGGETARFALRVIERYGDAGLATAVFDVADDPELRELAAEALVVLPAVPEETLRIAANSPLASRRALAAAAAVRLDAVPGWLFALADDADEEVRASAVATIAAHGTEQRYLLSALGDSSDLVRTVALDAIAGTSVMRCEEFDSLFDSDDPGVRAAAAMALGACVPPEAARDLAASAVRDDSPEVRAAAARAIRAASHLADPKLVRRLLADEEAVVRAAAADALLSEGFLSDEESVALLEDGSPIVRSVIGRHMAAAGRPGFDAVQYLLGDGDPRVLVAVLRSLRVASPGILDRLSSLATSPYSDVREAVVRAALRVAPPTTTAQLAHAMSSDPAWNVRASALEVLGAVAPDLAEEIALVAVDDDDVTVRHCAVRVLFACHSERIIGRLEDLLADAEIGEEVRAALARTGAMAVPVLLADVVQARADDAVVSAVMLMSVQAPERAEAVEMLLGSDVPGVKFSAAAALAFECPTELHELVARALASEADLLVAALLHEADSKCAARGAR